MCPWSHTRSIICSSRWIDWITPLDPWICLLTFTRLAIWPPSAYLPTYHSRVQYLGYPPKHAARYGSQPVVPSSSPAFCSRVYSSPPPHSKTKPPPSTTTTTYYHHGGGLIIIAVNQCRSRAPQIVATTDKITNLLLYCVVVSFPTLLQQLIVAVPLDTLDDHKTCPRLEYHSTFWLWTLAPESPSTTRLYPSCRCYTATSSKSLICLPLLARPPPKTYLERGSPLYNCEAQSSIGYWNSIWSVCGATNLDYFFQHIFVLQPSSCRQATTRGLRPSPE